MAYFRIQLAVDRTTIDWSETLAWLNKVAFFGQEWAGPAAVRH
jgi:hypothetical protein